ncbi:zinc finger protein PLAG1-like [Chrysoperla carnea]|uniref:zinc finger protein PLAG1-like n=1 Tax=Chrysoperla carnea TaxID=189513 RepID=UPI001D065F69|nr:zinc finger protein PLAG1-like [Chrysoperla carnea]
MKFDDKLPQTVCTSCADKVENFYNFYLSAQKLQIISFTQINDSAATFSESESFDNFSIINDTKLREPIHEEWRHYQWKCSDCPGVFEALDDLRNHYHNYHKKPATYTCDKCFKSFKMFRNLHRHTRACKYKKK